MAASPATWRARHCISVIIKGKAAVGRLDERALRGGKGGSSESKPAVAVSHLFHSLRRKNSVERRAAEEVELVKTGGTTGPCRRVGRGEKGKRERVEKRRGMTAFL